MLVTVGSVDFLRLATHESSIKVSNIDAIELIFFGEHPVIALYFARPFKGNTGILVSKEGDLSDDQVAEHPILVDTELFEWLKTTFC